MARIGVGVRLCGCRRRRPRWQDDGFCRFLRRGGVNADDRLSCLRSDRKHSLSFSGNSMSPRTLVVGRLLVESDNELISQRSCNGGKPQSRTRGLIRGRTEHRVLMANARPSSPSHPCSSSAATPICACLGVAVSTTDFNASQRHGRRLFNERRPACPAETNAQPSEHSASASRPRRPGLSAAKKL